MEESGKNETLSSHRGEKVQEHRLSIVSKMYDRDNKGFLDSTELALRHMDTENTGEFSNENIFKMMKDLKTQQAKAMNLKRVVIALSIFATLVVLANVGTSFAMAKLVQQLSNDSSAANAVYTVAAVKEDDASNAETEASTSFLISTETAESLMTSICTGWPGMMQYESTSTFSCRLSGTASLEHCDNEYMTALKYHKKPTLSPDHSVLTFHYLGERGGYNVGKVTIQCDLVNKESDTQCAVSGLTCDTLCDTCTETGGRLLWWCGENQGCGCKPGTEASCWDTSDTAGLPTCDKQACVVDANMYYFDASIFGP